MQSWFLVFFPGGLTSTGLFVEKVEIEWNEKNEQPFVIGFDCFYFAYLQYTDNYEICFLNIYLTWIPILKYIFYIAYCCLIWSGSALRECTGQFELNQSRSFGFKYNGFGQFNWSVSMMLRKNKCNNLMNRYKTQWNLLDNQQFGRWGHWWVSAVCAKSTLKILWNGV